MRKILSVLTGVLSIGVAVFTLWLCVYAAGASVKLYGDPGESGEILARFFDCLRAEQWDEAYGCLYNDSTLGLEAEPEDTLSARFWKAQKQVWDFRVAEDWALDGTSIKRQVTVRGLDMDAIRDDIAIEVQALLAEAVENAYLASDVYDENGDYREDVAIAALRRAAENVLRDVSAYAADRELTVDMRLRDGKWYVFPEKELLSALTSGASDFGMYINNLAATVMDGVLPIPKVYYLAEDVVVAPEPDPSLFGSSDTPEDTAAVLRSAAGLLAGDSTLWQPDTQLFPGTPVRWYLDETILVFTWKEVINSCAYTFSEVKIAHPSQFRRYLADNSFSSPIQYAPSEMAVTVNAVAAMNGDFYKFRNMGHVVYQRELYRVEGKTVDNCFVDAAGNLRFVRRGELLEPEAVRAYIEDNDILFSLSFGPVLIENGEFAVPDYYPLGEINDLYARSAICQLGDCHYLMVAVNQEGPYTNAASAADLARALLDKGVPNAYTLDGGQTAAIIMNDELINAVQFGYQRNISDIIYFATALPEQGGKEA